MAPAKKKIGLKKCIRKTAVKPRNRSNGRFLVKSIETLCPDIVVTFCCRSSDENHGAYVKPMVDAYAADIDNGGPTPELFNVHYVTSRRAVDKNVARKISAESGKYDWDLFVTINDDCDVSAVDIGENIAERFSNFSAENYESQTFKFEGANESEAKLPVNAYMLDWDTVVLLRKIYSDSTKEELMHDEEVMEMFFGSVASGRAILKQVSPLKWNSIF